MAESQILQTVNYKLYTINCKHYTMSGSSLIKRLNLFDSTAIVIGSMIGSGIFIVSAEMAGDLGA